MVCYSCMNFLGDAEFQMDILSGTTSRQIISQQGGKHGSSVIAVPCKNECGELYCSSVCAETHWNNGHKHLCTGKISEEEGHHPDIMFGWGYVKINITTHAIEGLSENDFILAAKIDEKTNV